MYFRGRGHLCKKIQVILSPQYSYENPKKPPQHCGLRGYQEGGLHGQGWVGNLRSWWLNSSEDPYFELEINQIENWKWRNWPKHQQHPKKPHTFCHLGPGQNVLVNWNFGGLLQTTPAGNKLEIGTAPSPTIRIRTSFFPKRLLKTLDKVKPIAKQSARGEQREMKSMFSCRVGGWGNLAHLNKQL